MKSLINPYELLGVTINSTLKEVKKAYYNMSLLCHPDKGGSDKDMIVVHNSYLYIKKQLENCTNKPTLENIEDDFKNYFKNNYRKPPLFYEIWLDSDQGKFIREFNKEFDKKSLLSNNKILNKNIIFDTDKYNKGYGYLMEKTDFNSILYDDFYKIIICKFKLHKNIKKKILRYLINLKNKFVSKDIIIHKNPEKLNENNNYFSLIENEEIKDFSLKLGKLEMTDYYKAYSNINSIKDRNFSKRNNRTFQELKEEREKFDKIILNDSFKSENILDNKKVTIL